jgi:hypothetical protein
METNWVIERRDKHLGESERVTICVIVVSMHESVPANPAKVTHLRAFPFPQLMHNRYRHLLDAFAIGEVGGHQNSGLVAIFLR